MLRYAVEYTPATGGSTYSRTDTSSNHALPFIPLRTYGLTLADAASFGTLSVTPFTHVQSFVPFTPPTYAPPSHFPFSSFHSMHTVAPDSLPVRFSVFTHTWYS